MGFFKMIWMATIAVFAVLAVLAGIGPSTADAATLARESELVRRVVVFPLKTDQDFGTVTEDAWWKLREELSVTQRFLIASRQFLQQRDVFQPRAALTSADVIILGRLLDAHTIITTFIEDRTVTMIVYEAENGTVLWNHKLTMHASIPVKNQLLEVTRRLIDDFIASIPYQGYVVQDEIEGAAVSERDGKKMAVVNIGHDVQVLAGDPVQFVRMERENLKPLFEDGGKLQILAEGVVLKIDREQMTVQITRILPGEQISEFTQVRLPKEYQRLRKEFALVEREVLNPSLVSQNLKNVHVMQDDEKPLATTLGFIAGLTTFLLLAL